jgi:predicted DNA-binding transcriptional regulator AlpA
MALNISAKQVGTLLGITGNGVLGLERRGFLVDATGRTGRHIHYYNHKTVRDLQKVYGKNINGATLRERLTQHAAGVVSNGPGRRRGGATAAWLTAFLRARGGTALVSEILRTAQEAGHSRYACYSARTKVGIFSLLLGASKGGLLGTERGSLGWSLPGTAGIRGALDAAPHGDVHVERSVPTPDSSRLLRPADVARIFNLSSTTLWRLERIPGFPKKYRLSDNAVGFRENEIQAWVEARRGVGVRGQLKRGRPRKEPQQADAVHNVDIPPPAATPSSEQQRHDGITAQLADLHAKLNRLLSIWE